MRSSSIGMLASVAALSLGCLGRTGLDDGERLGASAGDAEPDTNISIREGGTDASTSDDATSSDTSTGADTTFSLPDGFDIFEVFPIPESGPIGDCAGCVRDKCGKQVNACITDPDCVRGTTCVLSTCLAAGGGAGGFDFGCVSKCFDGDFAKAAKAISVFTCITSGCGTKCGGAFGGLPGAGSGSGGSPSPAPPPPPSARLPSKFTDLEHTWTSTDVAEVDPKMSIWMSRDGVETLRACIAR